MQRMRTRWIGWGLLYLALVTLTAICTIQTWTHGQDGLVVLVSNAAWILHLPAWVMLYAVIGPGIRTDPAWIIAANLIGWAGWFGLIWIMRAAINALPQPEVSGAAVPARRAFIAQSTLGGLGVIAAGSAGYSTLVEPWRIAVRKYTIPINGLPASLSGLRIVHVSDTHLGPRIPRSHIEEAYRLVIEQKPDLIIHTGDHVHDGIREIDAAAALCRPLVDAAPLGVIGTLGNHDWWGDGHRLSAALSSEGVRMIDNQRIFLNADRQLVHEPPESGLAIPGLGDLTDHEVLVDQAFAGIPDSMPRLVLAHNPDTAEIQGLADASAPRVDLMLSGHTHGGQVRIPFLGTPIVPSRYGQKYAGGLVDGPRFPVLISRGIGMSLLPVRLGVPPEISVIELRG